MARWALPAIAALGLLLPAAAAADQASAGPPARVARLSEMMRERSSRGGGELPVQPLLWLKSSNGYVVEVMGIGDAVAVDVLRADGDSGTGYVVRGTVTAGRLQANFGKYGKLAMRFQPSKHSAWVGRHRVCHGADRFVRRTGVYVGEFRFRGEGGYISVRAHRAHGIVRSVAAACAGGHSSPQAQDSVSHPAPVPFFGVELPFLEARWRHGVSSAEVGAFGPGKALVSAATEESHGRMAIFRSAFVLSRAEKTLTVDDALTSARLSPSAPFSGTGIYRAAADGTRSWTGSLAVNFPGAPHYRLTGPPFKPVLGKE